MSLDFTSEAKLLLFDLDGVLVDSEILVESALREWALSLSLNPDTVIKASKSRRDVELAREIVPFLCPYEQSAEISNIEIGLCHTLTEIKGARDFYLSIPEPMKGVVTSSSRTSAKARLDAVDIPIPKLFGIVNLV